MQDMAKPTQPLRPQSLRSQTSQPHQRTQGSGPWRVLGGFLVGVMTAATLWSAFGRPTPHQFAALTKQNTALTQANTALQRQRDAAQEAVHHGEESRQLLEAQHTLLAHTNLQYENTTQEALVHLLLARIALVVEQLQGKFVLPVGVRSDETMMVQRVFTINHPMAKGFDAKSWHAVIAYVKRQLREYNTQPKGIKYDISVMNQLNLKVAIDLALGDISDWGETEKAFIQALREKMNGYIQNNPEEFSPPLHFVFTGVDMTVSEANKERQRVAHLYEALEMEEQHFASSIQATVANVFLHVWPALAHVPSWRLNGSDDWYVRAARNAR